MTRNGQLTIVTDKNRRGGNSCYSEAEPERPNAMLTISLELAPLATTDNPGETRQSIARRPTLTTPDGTATCTVDTRVRNWPT